MKKLLIVLVIAAVIVGLIIFSLLSRGTHTASEMADQTIFNASKNVWTYEQFYKNYNDYGQYKKQVDQADKDIKGLEAAGKDSGQRYDNLIMQRDGARQMMNNIAREYNKMSQVAYQKLWKSKGLPEKLE